MRDGSELGVIGHATVIDRQSLERLVSDRPDNLEYRILLVAEPLAIMNMDSRSELLADGDKRRGDAIGIEVVRIDHVAIESCRPQRN